MSFLLHSQLQADCHSLGLINDNHLLLHKNALLPWFILVPHTLQDEIYKLPAEQQQRIQEDTGRIAFFIEQHFNPDKLNIATIGNIVPQLHIHIIGRFKDDFCWPAPVWGQNPTPAAYTNEDLRSLTSILIKKNLINPITID